MHCSTPLKNPFRSFIPKMQVKRMVEDDTGDNFNELQIDMATKSPLRNIVNLCDDKSDILFTPKKSKVEYANPDTPTCNIKLLTRVAASLEYAKSDIDKENVKEKGQQLANSVENKFQRTPSLLKTRKEKSISVICEKFIKEFPEYPDPNLKIPISLTEAANCLGVEKRRVYDIVNILESVEMVKKSCKNEYLWCGKTELASTLQSLKNLALLNGLDKILKRAVLSEQGLHSVHGISCMKETLPSQFFAAFKKEKSLGTLARQFLSLFLTEEKPLIISLSVAAQLLLGNTECMSSSTKRTEFKTKVRRLYDVANVLSPLKILKREDKKHGCNSPSFFYCGPNLSRVFSGLQLDVIPESQSSMPKLDHVKNFQFHPVPKSHSSDSFSRTKSENWCLGHETPSKKVQSFVRHSSLQDICDVAEIERAKLSRSISSQLFNENSDDSNFSFLSYSTDASLVESHCEETMEALPQDTQNLTTLESTSEDCEILSEKEIETPTYNQALLSEYCKMQQVLKLTPEQQAAVLNYLNVTYENGQVALLLIPSDQSRNHLEGDAGLKKKIVLPMSLFTDLKNQQTKQNVLPCQNAASIFSPLLKISTNTSLETSSTNSSHVGGSSKSSQTGDSTKKQLTVVCDKENLGLKIPKFAEPAVLPKYAVQKQTSILLSNVCARGTENNDDRSPIIKRRKSGSVDATCSILNFPPMMSRLNNDSRQNEPLNACASKQKLSCGTCGGEDIKLVDVNLTGNKSTLKISTGVAAIKEKVVNCPITVHLQKSVMQNETTGAFYSPKTLVRKPASLIIIKKPNDKISHDIIDKNL